MPDPTVPVVASTGLAELLTGAVRPGVVVGVGPAAAYVTVDAPPASCGPAVVAVEAPGAVGLPCGVGLTTGAPGGLPGGLVAGTRVEVGAGRLDVDGARLVVARWRRARPVVARLTVDDLRPRTRTARSRLPGATDPLAAAVLDGSDALTRAASAGDLDAATAVAADLCGLGEGSTPSGDDVVAGAVAAGTLLATATTDADGPAAGWWAELGRRAAAHAVGRTTTLAAALLAHAARGEVADPVAALLRALVGDGEVAAATDRLLGVGHRSGGDLARGVLLAADAVAAPSACAREVARA